MNVRLVYVSADHKGMIALGKTLGKFHTQPVRFFRSDLTGAERLAHMIGDHIIRAAHSSGSGNVLPLCQKKLCIRSPAAVSYTHLHKPAKQRSQNNRSSIKRQMKPTGKQRKPGCTSQQNTDSDTSPS